MLARSRCNHSIDAGSSCGIQGTSIGPSIRQAQSGHRPASVKTAEANRIFGIFSMSLLQDAGAELAASRDSAASAYAVGTAHCS